MSLLRRAPIAVLCGVVLLASVILRPEWLPTWYTCPTLAFTGFPCPGCGMSHAFIAIAHGRFGEAWHHNALSFPLFAAMIALLFTPVRKLAGAHLGWRTALVVFGGAWLFNVGRIWL
jgi:hypothetical protein